MRNTRSNRILPPLAVAAAVFLLSATAAPAVAQIPIPGPPPQQGQPQPEDTIEVEVFRVEPPISPMGALWRSILLPGWGQAVLGRRVTGAFFVFWEGVTLGMTIKSAHQLSFQDGTADPETVEAKRQEVQDWAVLLAFNHLMAGAEAFVSSMLWDFPDELKVAALPGGRFGVSLSLPLP